MTAYNNECWLRLSLCEGLGPALIGKLLAEFGTPEAALAASRSQVTALIGDRAAASLQRGCEDALWADTLQWLQSPGNFVVTLDAPDYPALLREIPQAPPLLYAKGRRELLTADMFAMVGSRNPTGQGENTATAFAKALSDTGLTVVSGLALGIDGHAHRGALQGRASSIAVVGTGLDRVYPARHRDLARELAERGLVISEFPLGTPPLPGNFPRRNRIISGLARGCLVVEAALNSGSLVTARLAASQGRDVFAIPGSIHSPLSKGCHALIKEGAKLVESVSDILDEIDGRQYYGTGRNESLTASPTDPSMEALLTLMSYDPIGVDRLCDLSGQEAGALSAQLLQLELAGVIVTLPGGLYQRVI